MSVFTAWWAERAQRAEQDADRMASYLSEFVRRHHMPEAEYRDAIHLLADWRDNRERRYRALPAGHTLAGNLSSGGVEM